MGMTFFSIFCPPFFSLSIVDVDTVYDDYEQLSQT
jgi:hypothetical protein